MNCRVTPHQLVTVQRMWSPDVNTLLNVWNSHCSASLFNVSETFRLFWLNCLLINCKIRPQNKTDVRPKWLLQSSSFLAEIIWKNCKVRPKYKAELCSFRTLGVRTWQFILHMFIWRIKQSCWKGFELCNFPNFAVPNFAVSTVHPLVHLNHIRDWGSWKAMKEGIWHHWWGRPLL